MEDAKTAFSRQRSLLAVERTFLSWVRTGLSFVAGGVALMRLLAFTDPAKIVFAKVVGGLLMVMGMLVLFLCFCDYIHRKRVLSKVYTVQYAASFWFSAIMCLFLIVVSLAFLVGLIGF